MFRTLRSSHVRPRMKYPFPETIRANRPTVSWFLNFERSISITDWMWKWSPIHSPSPFCFNSWLLIFSFQVALPWTQIVFLSSLRRSHRPKIQANTPASVDPFSRHQSEFPRFLLSFSLPPFHKTTFLRFLRFQGLSAPLLLRLVLNLRLRISFPQLSSLRSGPPPLQFEEVVVRNHF